MAENKEIHYRDWRKDLDQGNEDLQLDSLETCLKSNVRGLEHGGWTEQFIISEILNYGSYDVLCPVIDYGIDIIALKRESILKTHPKLLYIQVKSVTVHENRHFSVNINGMFLKMMEEKKNWCLIIYLFMADDNPAKKRTNHLGNYIGNLPLYIWIDGRDIVNDVFRRLKSDEVNRHGHLNYILEGFVNWDNLLDLSGLEKKTPTIAFTGCNGNKDIYRLSFSDKMGTNPKKDHFDFKSFLKQNN